RRQAVPQAVRRARLNTALAIAVLTAALLTTVSDTVYDKQHQLQGLNGQIVATKTQIAQLLAQERQLQGEIAAFDAQLRAVQVQIDQETAKLVLLAQQVDQAKEQLALKQAELAQHIAAIGAQFQRLLADMEAQRAALQAQIASLIHESFRARSSGKWKWPTDGVITQGFGCTSYPFEPYDPSCPSLHFHSGIDLAADYGTPVHASDGGIVHNFTMGCGWGGGLCGY